MRMTDFGMLIAMAGLIFCLHILGGCSGVAKVSETAEAEEELLENEDEHMSEYRVKTQENEYPEDVETWINRLNQLNRFPLWHSRLSGDSLYVYIGWGEKPTGGYRIEIKEKKIGDQHIEITADFQSPEPGAMVTQALTFPYSVAVLEARDIPIEIMTEGEDAPAYIQTIKGITDLPPIHAGAERIVIFEPEPGSRVNPDFEVQGLATVFEGTLNYRLLDAQGDILEEGFTTTVDGMNWAYFSFKPALVLESDNLTDRIILNLFAIDAKDGEEISGFEIKLETELP